MIRKIIKHRLLSSFLAFALLMTSCGGAFAVSAAAADSATPATEDSVKTNSPSKDLLAGIAAIGLIAAMSTHKGSSNVTPQKSPNTTTGSPKGSGTPSGSASTSEEQQAINLLNSDRAANGLPALKVNSQLTTLARNYAQDMIKRGFFSHYNPEGQSPFDRMQQAGISYNYAGENLAINTSVPTAETAFMNSAGHRANILSPNYTEVGIGLARNASGQLYAVQEFIGK